MGMNVFGIFGEGSWPFESVLGLDSGLSDRTGVSELFGGASYPVSQREKVLFSDRLLGSAIGAGSGRFHRTIVSPKRAFLCRGNFFISKCLEGSSPRLKQFWARIPVCRAERVDQPFSLVTGWRPFKRAKPAAWDPPPGFPMRAYSG